MFEKFLKFLQGKKTMILAVIVLTATFLKTMDLIPQPVSDFIKDLAAILFGSTAIATSVMYKVEANKKLE